MYGLVNKAIYQLVMHKHGAEKWHLIRAKAGFPDEEFLSMENYPDETTYNLIRAASEVLKLSPEEVLEAFGEYWITYTAEEGYGSLLEMAGDTFVDFVRNLDQLHSCVGNIMPKLTPPSFQCTDVTPHSLLLHHYSGRRGLEHMVIGLLRGLAKRFNTPCRVTLQQSTSTNADHNVFLVEW
jgi:hypothetical protein